MGFRTGRGLKNEVISLQNWPSPWPQQWLSLLEPGHAADLQSRIPWARRATCSLSDLWHRSTGAFGAGLANNQPATTNISFRKRREQNP